MQLLLGSGKTAVLVERIIQKIIKEKIDVDKILVVTFTNTAASEMRERILDAIYKKLEEDPKNIHLQKQIMLLNKANISTIHSFCLEVIKNNFYELDISPNFRIGDTAEIELLKQDAIEDTFDDLYEKQEEGFLKLIDTYAGYRKDDDLKEIVLKIYQYIQSTPFPYEWLNEKIEMFNIDEKIDFSETIWGKLLLEDLKQNLNQAINKLEFTYNKLKAEKELLKYANIISSDINLYKDLIRSINSWDMLYEKSNSISYEDWPRDKKVFSEEKDWAKQIRDKTKKQVTEMLNKILIYNSKQANLDIKNMYYILKNLENLIILFKNNFSQKKKEKNCIDFNDIEHFALNILVKKENGEYTPTDVAKKYQQKFEEIAIDEYQDSNLVQEYILTTISRKNNVFMVGDVKQSIYKFRQARPELFLEKYEKYSLLENKKAGENLKIQLFQNFRSRSNILNITNLVFDTIMTKKLGDIEYNEKEYLRQDKDYEAPKENIKNYAGKTELHIIDLAKEEQEEQEENENEKLEKTQIEAKYVAKKIKELTNSNYYVFDKKIKEYRKVTYKDIVILLRATTGSAQIYEKEISDLEMPVFSDTSSEYLASIEIQTVLSVLKILDNPLQDIPLISVLRSYIGGFTDNDLIKIRLLDKNAYFYDALKLAKDNEDIELKRKANRLFEFLEKWKNEQEYLSLEELIWNIYMDTGFFQYVSVMPDGNLKLANLKMLLEKAKQYEESSFKGLFNFIHFIDKLKNSSGDLGSAKIIGENENVIRIMSIHKSKGLEFPIVFLCGTGKQFNMQDLNEKLIMHHELGFGPKYIDSEKGIEFNTLAKEAIRIKIKKEAISEEMRVLYVALTRAREKLIITGVEKNFDKSTEEKKMLIQMNNGINEALIEKYTSYLGWLEIVSIEKKQEISGLMDIYINGKKDILAKKQENEGNKKIIEEFYNTENKKNKELERLLKWKYSYIKSTKIPSKTSVTEIKKDKLQENKFEAPVPLFLKEVQELSASQKGSVLHLVLQKLDLRKAYTKDEIKNEIQKLVTNKILTDNEAESVSIYKIQRFLQSNLAKQIKNANKIYKETPFYMNLTAREANIEEIDEKILVQGIIDLFFIKQDGNIILVDYKTDYVKDERELIEKYKKQLELYKKAIEEATKKRVEKTYIYSIYLEKEIEVL